MTRFDLYVHADRRSRRETAWPAVRVLLWLLLCGGLAFWAMVLWTTVSWAPR